MSEKYARLTFNDSAQKTYLGESNGLRVKIEGGNVLVRPAADDHQIALMPSPSGKMADIDSAESSAKRMMQFFQNCGYSSEQPFFVLCDGPSKGWLKIEHFPFEKAPAKSVPYFRVWPLLWAPAQEAANTTIDMNVWREARQMVLRACETIREYESTPRVGRPPKAVMEAEEVMGSLHQLLAELARVNNAAKPTVIHRSAAAAADMNDISAKVMSLIEQKRKKA